MGRKAKYTYEQKLQAVHDYMDGTKSATEIARELDMGNRGEAKVRRWAKLYEANGPDSLYPKEKNTSYSKEFKNQVVNDYTVNGLSYIDLMAKYNISSMSVIMNWISRYNSHMEQKDYDSHPEVYMAKARSKKTYEEKLEIVKYCIENGKNYVATASKYNCSYDQVRNWVIKYEQKGEIGLNDKRGRHKKEEELTDLEKANRRIAQLESMNRKLEMENELLKKAEEVERKWFTGIPKQ